MIIAGNVSEGWAEKWPDLKAFSGRDDVQIISTAEHSATGDAHLSAEELRNLQQRCGVDATLFVIPEFFRDEFIRISLGNTKNLVGRNVGIFGSTTEWYPGETAYGGQFTESSNRNLNLWVGNLKRRLFEPWKNDKYFFEKILIQNRILDSVIVKDERVIEYYGSVVRWLPEIYKVFNASDASNNEKEYEKFAPIALEFVAKFNPDDLVLFFGSGAWYKGYDYFLQLIINDSTSAGMHFGAGIQFNVNKPFDGDLVSLRDDLIGQGRLFETNGYVQSQKLIDLAFTCCHRFISTHRLTLSSGTMLQALDYGLPVLVPDAGLVGHRARSNGIGLTYEYGNIHDLADKWHAFRKIPVEAYADRIKTFMARFERKEIESLVVSTLLET